MKWTQYTKWFVAFSVLLAFTACNETDSNSGFVTIEVGNSRAPAGIDIESAFKRDESSTLKAFSVETLAQFPALQVDHFKITFTGAGIEAPLEFSLSASESSLQINEIPAGPNRSLLIEAFNSAGQVIRRRRVDDITIQAGIVTPVQTTLNTVPLILNLKPGSAILARNFRVLGFGEPGTSLNIAAQTQEQFLNLNESVSEGPLVSPSLNTGLFEASPAFFLTGKQTITLTDENSGESSSVSVFILDGNRPGTKFVTSSQPKPLTSVGTGLGGLKAHFPTVLRTLSDPASLGGNQ